MLLCWLPWNGFQLTRYKPSGAKVHRVWGNRPLDESKNGACQPIKPRISPLPAREEGWSPISFLQSSHRKKAMAHHKRRSPTRLLLQGHQAQASAQKKAPGRTPRHHVPGVPINKLKGVGIPPLKPEITPCPAPEAPGHLQLRGPKTPAASQHAPAQRVALGGEGIEAVDLHLARRPIDAPPRPGQQIQIFCTRDIALFRPPNRTARPPPSGVARFEGVSWPIVPCAVCFPKPPGLNVFQTHKPLNTQLLGVRLVWPWTTDRFPLWFKRNVRQRHRDSRSVEAWDKATIFSTTLWLLPKYGCGSKPMVPFWGRCSTHVRNTQSVLGRRVDGVWPTAPPEVPKQQAAQAPRGRPPAPPQLPLRPGAAQQLAVRQAGDEPRAGRRLLCASFFLWLFCFFVFVACLFCVSVCLCVCVCLLLEQLGAEPIIKSRAFQHKAKRKQLALGRPASPLAPWRWRDGAAAPPSAR